MPNPGIRTGKIFISIDGTLYESATGATLEDPMGLRRKPQVGNAVYGYTEEAVPPKITAKFSHGSGLSAQALAAVTNATIEFKCDSGVTFVLRQCFYMDSMKLTGGEGWLDVTFGSKAPAREQGVTAGIVNS